MKKILADYYRTAITAFVALVLVTPMAFLIIGYSTLLYKYLRLMVLWLY
jgi:hypothetical protein